MDRENSLDRAWLVQHAASDVGFDWDHIQGPLHKVKEELREIEVEINARDDVAAQEELGDLLFAVVNLSRFLNLHPDVALTRATKKFERRFSEVKRLMEASGRTIADCSLVEMDAVWDRVKASEAHEKK
jgi:uncharacterized protein YabN with tetrapyrrole methylase and pyrophosphatase domain